MDSLGTLLSPRRGKLWVGFLSHLRRKSSSLLQAPAALAIAQYITVKIFDLLLHWSYICCKAHKNISQPLTCESTFLAAHSGLSTGAHDCRVPDKATPAIPFGPELIWTEKKYRSAWNNKTNNGWNSVLAAQGQEDTQSLEDGKSNLAEMKYCSVLTPLLPISIYD